MTALSGQTPWGDIRRFGTRLRKRSGIHGSSRDWLPQMGFLEDNEAGVESQLLFHQ
jgi:hypothetical protein